DARDLAARARQRRFIRHEELEARHDRFRRIELADALRDHPRDHRRSELPRRGQQPFAAMHFPLAMLVVLADDARAFAVGPVVELLLQLVFDQLAFFFDDENFLQALGEIANASRFERPRHADLAQADADLGGVLLVDAQVLERLQYVEIALARGDDAQARIRRIDDDAVQAIHARVSKRG